METDGDACHRGSASQLAEGVATDERHWDDTRGRLDLSNNAFIVDDDGTSPLATIQAQIIKGRDAGSWGGTSDITASSAANAGATAVGYAHRLRHGA